MVRAYPYGKAVILVIGLLLVGSAASAQSTNYSSAEAEGTKQVQLGFYASAHKNCTPAEAPTVRVITPPKFGTLIVRKAVLQTNKVEGCPGLKTAAQVAFYQAKEGFTGPDHVTFETTAENGEVGVYDFTITVKAAPATTPPNDDAKGKSL